MRSLIVSIVLHILLIGGFFAGIINQSVALTMISFLSAWVTWALIWWNLRSILDGKRLALVASEPHAGRYKPVPPVVSPGRQNRDLQAAIRSIEGDQP